MKSMVAPFASVTRTSARGKTERMFAIARFDLRGVLAVAERAAAGAAHSVPWPAVEVVAAPEARSDRGVRHD